MEYKGYTINEKGKSIQITNIKDFNPVQIFECGQCFRWRKQKDGSYTGVVKEKVLNLRFSDGVLEISNTSMDEFKDIWFDYLDLGRDYTDIKNKIMKDEVMEKAISFGSGMRILKQDLWEMIISFIFSANNRIPMIMKTIEAVCEKYGNEIEYDGNTYFTFPGIDALSATKVQELEVCRGGFRCKYVVETARKIASGEVDIKGLQNFSAAEAGEVLMRLPGIGPKVSDCILLYSGTKYEVFPTDVWVKRVMQELYFKREASIQEIRKFAWEYFGELAGFAQLYLFYYARENGIGAG